jgi:hypothetical protein
LFPDRQHQLIRWSEIPDRLPPHQRGFGEHSRQQMRLPPAPPGAQVHEPRVAGLFRNGALVGVEVWKTYLIPS